MHPPYQHNKAHFRRVLEEYINYFNTRRPHQGILQDLPARLDPSDIYMPICCRKVLAGVHPRLLSSCCLQPVSKRMSRIATKIEPSQDVLKANSIKSLTNRKRKTIKASCTKTFENGLELRKSVFNRREIR